MPLIVMRLLISEGIDSVTPRPGASVPTLHSANSKLAQLVAEADGQVPPWLRNEVTIALESWGPRT